MWGVRIVTAELPRGYVPPSASMDPAATLPPYGDPDACWDCGLEADAVRHTEFRHPLFGRRPNLCRYCADLRELIA